MHSAECPIKNLLLLIIMAVVTTGTAHAYQDEGDRKLTVAALPPAAQMAVNAAFGRDDGRYQIACGRGANPSQELMLDFNGSGVRVTTGRTSLGMTLSVLRIGDSEVKLSAVAPLTEVNRVEYRHGPVTEWYLNGPLGLEQGFTVNRPASGSANRLTLVLDLQGDVRGTLDDDQAGVTLSQADGTAILRYGGLQAWDATGRSLAARMELVPGAEGSQRLALRVDTVGAAWPVTVDPFVQQAKLNGVQGMSVALSSDGNTALVGAPNTQVGANGYQGAAYVFTRSGVIWSQQARIIDTNGTTGDTFGSAVALSSDGNTALIGIPGKFRERDFFGNFDSIGAVYIYTRSGTIWSQEALIRPNDGIGGDRFGWSVAVSSNGGVALIGAPYKVVSGQNSRGAAYIFTRSGATWGQMTRLSTADGAANDMFGKSVALSSDGTTALIGANGKFVNNYTSQGAAYVFTGAGAIWSQQARLSSVGSTSFGVTVSLSGDGNVALVGAPYTDMNNKYQQGTAYVFTRTGGVWGQPVILTAGDGTSQDRFGNAVSLSSDGTTALIAANFQSAARPGAVYLYTRSGLVWNQVAKQTASDGAIYDQFGIAVALSSDSSTALIGSLNMSWGAYVFSSKVDSTTSIELAAGTNPSIEGEVLTFLVLMKVMAYNGIDPTGTVRIMDGATEIWRTVKPVPADFFNIYLAATVTPHALTAIYDGDANYNGSTSPVLYQTVLKAVTYTVNFSAGANGMVSPDGGTTTVLSSVQSPIISGTNTTAITAVPDADYRFVNWTGDNGFVTTDVNPLIITNVTSDLNIKANFSYVPPARIDTVPPQYFSSLQAACNAALSGQTVQARIFTFVEDLALTKATDIIIQGGYDTSYLSQSGYSVLQGKLTVGRGTLVTERLTVK
jgi:uncharacterized repeat protein (TIGR02543 family)